ncbi:glycosyltransferase family 2 protein [Thalassotalea ponticola]|uniref:glycosyltransferase family 2 protein n=1 Tax=Thalassotalea ponticola TaxID=1523392 RepID=UPI0025B32311|nr:glycosyltransferase family 2 protein [Thalassotalea ponticola]MDN3651739.1 glycosyltransferase family 2 protein [Thalassotalea ponticola]
MISIVCPVYNEQQSVGLFIKKMKEVMQCKNVGFEFLFIDDGSDDETLRTLREEKRNTPQIRIISFSRNFGKEAALTAGLKYAKGDAVIPIDVDMQDPPELVLKLLDEWQKGYQIVLAKRVDRNSDSYLKRLTAKGFYYFHNKMADHKIPENVGDFRLMGRVVVDHINELPETQRFMKGLFSWVGFKSSTINYARPCRENGESKFTFWKLWNLAIEGITSFSTIPLKIWTYIGVIVALLSFCYGVFIIALALLSGIDVPGYSSLIVIILFLGGIQLIGIGILGEYIGRIYMEAKQRPLYIIEKEY